MAHPGQLVPKAALLDAVWPETTVNDVALMICIRELRQALGDDARAPRFIETVHRRGYRFVGDLPVTTPASHSPPSAMHSVLPPVGRQEELRRLHIWLARARSGVRQVVFITGEAGLGKTALVEAFVAEVGAQGSLRIGHGQCVEHYGAGEAYLPVLEALGRLCRGPGGQEVVTLLGQHAPTWLVQMPGLVRATDLETLKHRMVGATRERMLRELAEALELLTTRQPLVLVIEDLHWSDPSTLGLLAVLARRREPARLLLIGTYRPPEVRRRAHPLHSVMQELQVHEHCVELPLPLLPEGAVTAYLSYRLPGLPQVAQLAHLVHQRTEGNPLFMVALVASWLTQGVLMEQDGVWTLSAGVEALQDSVPESLRQMIDRQLGWLSAEEQQVLAAASVAGMEFSAAAVAAGLAQEAEGVDDGCTSLARREQFLRAIGERTWPDGTVAGCYSFGHALYQQVLYQRVSAAQRARLHRRIGARLEVGHDAQAGVMAAELAMHFERGRDYQRAVQYLWHAGERSIERSAYVEAMAHCTKGLEMLQTLPDTPARAQQELAMRIPLGQALIATRGQAAPEVGRTYIRARTLCQQVGEPSQRVRVMYGLWQFHNVRAEFPPMQALSEELLALAQHLHDPMHLLGAHYIRAATLFCLGEFGPSREHWAQSLVHYDPQQHHASTFLFCFDLGVFSLCWAPHSLWHLGYLDQALIMSRQALTMAQDLAHPFSLAAALDYAAMLHQFRREGVAVHEQAEAALALCTKQGFTYYLAWATFMQGWAAVEQGQGEEGIAQMRRGLAALRATGAALRLPYYLARLAEACGHTGQAAEGLALLAEALAQAYNTGERWWEAELHRLQGELLLLSRVRYPKFEALPSDSGLRTVDSEVEQCFHQALTIARRQRAKSLELRAAMSLARLWQHQDRRAAAHALLAPVYYWFTEGFDTPDLQEAKALLDRLA
jgi:predicted ATPase